MKVVIIENELNAKAALKKMLKLINAKIEVIGEYGHVNIAIEQLRNKTAGLGVHGHSVRRWCWF